MLGFRCFRIINPLQQFARATSKMSEVVIDLPPLGSVKGLQRKTIYDEVYTSFEGVPFAKPPLGPLRFKSPLPVEPWNSLRDCTEDNTIPAQAGKGTEDCLYLNIYCKNLKSDKPLPVMVYIYGGSFLSGDNTRDRIGPDYFMFENVILVIPNYRVSSLGFLSLSDKNLHVPGNAGLKDQVMALKWVQKYIKYFNGDANNVTLFGESAGAFSVHLLSAAEQTEHLFHKIIIMSASAFDIWGIAPQRDAGYRLAQSYGYKGENVDKLVLEFLNSLPAEQLTQSNLMQEQDLFDGSFFSFNPVVEPYESESCVIPKPPLESLRTAWSNKIPLMIGSTSFEGLVFNSFRPLFEPHLSKIRASPELLLPKEIKDMHTAEELKIMGEKLREHYFGQNAREKDEWMQIMDLFTDKMFGHGNHRAVLSRLLSNSAPTYLYLFDFDSEFFNHHRIRFMGPGVRGVAHADDLSYLLVLKETIKLNSSTDEFKTIKLMVGMWTAFAANSNPNCAELGDTKWEPVSKENPFNLLHIQDTLKFTEHPNKSRLEVWNSFYSKVPLV